MRLLPLLTILLAAAGTLSAQLRPGEEFAIKAVAPAVVKTPEFSYTGGDQRRSQPGQWLVVEAEFAARPELTPELTLKYYVLFSGNLLTGEVTHVNVPAGNSLFSVMYLSPRSIARLLKGGVFSSAAIENIAVVVTKPGVSAPLAEYVLRPNPKGQWWTTMQQTPGFLLNKTETPFAPLYWDRYEAIKTAK
ncbi:MAG: hypothetical protein JSR82_19870 [Verrucomicrobia bacterium]|nr:hypothetical protein [Verrucomicrobiota bacterium]